MPRLSNDQKDADKVYFPVMRCPKCGYETVVTNICRNCPETPADQELISSRFCEHHKMVHYRNNPDGSSTFFGHQAVIMVYTGKVSKFNPKTCRRMTRHYKPTDDEMGKIWCGWGVVFEE